MSNVVRLPIRAADNFALRGEYIHATVCDVAVVVAEIVCLTGPRTWGVFLRRDGEPDTLVFTSEIHDEADLDGFNVGMGNFAAVIEKTLMLSRQVNIAEAKPERPEMRFSFVSYLQGFVACLPRC